MTEKVFHYVRHHEVAAYERLGWRRHPALDGTHHGDWSALMEWCGTGEPVKPFRIDPPSCETSDAELRRAYELQPHARRFAEPREPGKVPVDPDAEQLAGDVGALAGELARGVA